MIGEILDRFSPGAIGWTVLGLIAALSVAVLILTLLTLGRKYFGRQPSFDEILKTLMSVDDFDDYKREQHLRHRGLEEQISKARHDFDERANSDLVEIGKRSEIIFGLMKEADDRSDRLSGVISRLEERTETHIRKFDQLEQKLDRTIERLPHPGRRYPGGAS